MFLSHTSPLVVVVAVSVALGVTSSCRQPPPPPITNHTVWAASTPSAEVYERGDGVPRDYARAFELHRAACRDGRGDLAACDAVIDAMASARGTAFDTRTLLAMLKTICEHGDDVNCARAWFLEAMLDQAWRDRRAPRSPEDEARTDAFEAAIERMEKACDDGSGRACAGLEDLAIGADESTRNRRNELACRAGFLAGCSVLISEMWGCEDWSADGTCELVMAEWRSNPGAQERLAVYERLMARCDAGEADACEGLPGRALPSATLCAAHDYAACSALACLGDDNAAAVARTHGALRLDQCHLAYARALRAWDRGDRDEPPPMAADPMSPMGARRTQPFEAILFRAHGGRDAQGWPRLDVHNVSDQDVVELTLCVVSFDADDHELARVHRTLDAARIPSNGSMQVDLARGAPVPRLGRTSHREVVTYDRIRFANGPAIEDPTRCPPLPWASGAPAGW